MVLIYGAKGAESRYLDYLSPKWMEAFGHAVGEAGRNGMGVDLTTGTGWCFGGPMITPELRGRKVVAKAGAGLVVEVINTGANRLRDLDLRKVPWRIFHDINFVSITYKPMAAAKWPVQSSGLLGPVRLTAGTSESNVSFFHSGL